MTVRVTQLCRGFRRAVSPFRASAVTVSSAGCRGFRADQRHRNHDKLAPFLPMHSRWVFTLGRPRTSCRPGPVLRQCRPAPGGTFAPGGRRQCQGFRRPWWPRGPCEPREVRATRTALRAAHAQPLAAMLRPRPASSRAVRREATRMRLHRRSNAPAHLGHHARHPANRSGERTRSAAAPCAPIVESFARASRPMGR